MTDGVLINPYRFGTAAFNPLTAVGWDHAWWTEGPEFVALGLSSGNSVSSWPDEIGTYDLAQGTGSMQPTYQATGGANSKPAIVHDSDDNLNKRTGVSLSAPWTTVVVASSAATGAAFKSILVSTPNAGTFLSMIYKNSSQKYDVYASGQITSPPNADTSPHLHTTYVAAGGKVMEIDGTGYTGGGSTSTITQLNLSSDELNGLAGEVTAMFVATYAGDARSDGGWQSFEDWVESYYGITIA